MLLVFWSSAVNLRVGSNVCRSVIGRESERACLTVISISVWILDIKKYKVTRDKEISTSSSRGAIYGIDTNSLKGFPSGFPNKKRCVFFYEIQCTKAIRQLTYSRLIDIFIGNTGKERKGDVPIVSHRDFISCNYLPTINRIDQFSDDQLPFTGGSSGKTNARFCK